MAPNAKAEIDRWVIALLWGDVYGKSTSESETRFAETGSVKYYEVYMTECVNLLHSETL